MNLYNVGGKLPKKISKYESYEKLTRCDNIAKAKAVCEMFGFFHVCNTDFPFSVFPRKAQICGSRLQKDLVENNLRWIMFNKPKS